MDLAFGYDDIPDCEDCNEDDGEWPGDSSSLDSLSTGETLLDDDFASGLARRESGKATLLTKDVTVCPDNSMDSSEYKFRMTGDGKYPAFPAPAGNPWDGIEQGKWDAITTYWGNKTAICSDWSTVSLANHDTALIGNSTGIHTVRAKYQSKSGRFPYSERLNNVVLIDGNSRTRVRSPAHR